MRTSTFLLMATVLCFTRAAFADEATGRADALFQEGRAAVRQGNWEKACPAFAESLKLDPAPGTRINLGECEERSGRLVAAFDLYERAARELSADDSRLPIARQRATAVDARIPRLVVPQGTVVRVDDDPTPKDGVLRIDPGRHVIVVIGSPERTVPITIVERERHAFDPNASPATSTPTRKVVGFTTAGVGLAAIATGLVFGGLALQKKNVVDGECDAAEICSQRGLDAKSDGSTMAMVSNVAVGVGVAALVVGVYLVLSTPKGGTPRAAADIGALRVHF
jgi:hypothetical protein